MKFQSGNKLLTNWLVSIGVNPKHVAHIMPSLLPGIMLGLGLCIRPYRYAS